MITQDELFEMFPDGIPPEAMRELFANDKSLTELRFSLAEIARSERFKLAKSTHLVETLKRDLEGFKKNTDTLFEELHRVGKATRDVYDEQRLEIQTTRDLLRELYDAFHAKGPDRADKLTAALDKVGEFLK